MNRLFLLFLLSLVACTSLNSKSPLRSTASGTGSTHAVFDFESGDWTGWSLKRLPAKDDAKVVRFPVRHGNFAAAIGLAPGVRYKDSWKNELSDRLQANFNEEIWYRVSHWIPDDFQPKETNSCMIAQWHNAAFVGFSPLLAHRYRNGVLRVTIEYGTADVPKSYDDVVNHVFFEIPFAKNRWHDFVYRAVWSRGETGLIQAWYNGKFMGTYRGPTGYKNDEDGPYFKTGVYCEESPERLLTAYVDEYRRGPTREDVLLPDEILETPPAP